MKRKLVILMVVCLLVTALMPCALADSVKGVIKTPAADGSVNIRSEAGVSHSIVGWAKNGAAVEILYQGNKWHKVKNICEWSTASVSLKGDAVTVSVNGQKVTDGVKLPAMIDGEPMAKSGKTRFLADDDGATVRGYCFLRR